MANLWECVKSIVYIMKEKRQNEKKRKETRNKTYKTQRNQNLGTQKDFVLPCLKHR